MPESQSKYDRLINRAKQVSAARGAVVHPCDESSLSGVVQAAANGLLIPVLVGPAQRIKAVAREHDLDIASFEVIDVGHSKLLVVTNDSANSTKPSLSSCNLDGTACTHTDLSAGQGALSGKAPSAVIDIAHGKLLVTTDNGANSDKLELFSLCLP